ncbi:hypothetical protein BJV77DRAFT_122723 [Russula vinacea]|nr:hypothetical protein BJV77DRAFT_122723 [Russula vinacea]
MLTALPSLHKALDTLVSHSQPQMSYYNSMLILPESDVASPATIIPMGSAMMVQASPSSYLCLPQSSSHESLLRPSSQYFAQPSSALYLPQQSSALLLQTPSLQLCVPAPYPSIASPSGSTGCPRCLQNSSNNRQKGGFKRWLRHLLGGRWTCK